MGVQVISKFDSPIKTEKPTNENVVSFILKRTTKRLRL